MADDGYTDIEKTPGFPRLDALFRSAVQMHVFFQEPLIGDHEIETGSTPAAGCSRPRPRGLLQMADAVQPVGALQLRIGDRSVLQLLKFLQLAPPLRSFGGAAGGGVKFY